MGTLIFDPGNPRSECGRGWGIRMIEVPYNKSKLIAVARVERYAN